MEKSELARCPRLESGMAVLPEVVVEDVVVDVEVELEDEELAVVVPA